MRHFAGYFKKKGQKPIFSSKRVLVHDMLSLYLNIVVKYHAPILD